MSQKISSCFVETLSPTVCSSGQPSRCNLGWRHHAVVSTGQGYADGGVDGQDGKGWDDEKLFDNFRAMQIEHYASGGVPSDVDLTDFQSIRTAQKISYSGRGYFYAVCGEDAEKTEYKMYNTLKTLDFPYFATGGYMQAVIGGTEKVVYFPVDNDSVLSQDVYAVDELYDIAKDKLQTDPLKWFYKLLDAASAVKTKTQCVTYYIEWDEELKAFAVGGEAGADEQILPADQLDKLKKAYKNCPNRHDKKSIGYRMFVKLYENSKRKHSED